VILRYSERVYRALRTDIVEWRLQPGDVLTEVDVAARLGVSRTPVREALQWLTREGLVRHTPGRGAVVADVSLDDVLELFQMREALESYAAGLAARSPSASDFEGLRTEFEGAGPRLQSSGSASEDVAWYFDLIDRLDDAVDSATRNARLVRAITETRGHIRRLRRLARLNPSRLQATAAEHQAICEAIAARDEARAVQTTRVHIHNSLHNVLRELAHHALGTIDDPAATSASLGGSQDDQTTLTLEPPQ
jgi:DNA-binding GntR family transcriptional regulator